MIAPPVLADGRLYAATGMGLFAINAASGERLWQSEFGGAFTSAALAGDTLYATNVETATGQPRIVAVTAATARPLWIAPLAGNPVGVTLSPDLLIVAAQGAPGGAASVEALDLGAGQVRWSSPVADVTDAPAVADDMVLATGRDGVLHALDLADGHERWSRKLGGVVRAPMIAGDVALIDRSGDLLALDTATGDERWRVSSGGSAALAATAGGAVYLTTPGSNRLTAEDLATGASRWSVTAGATLGAPGVAGGLVIVGSSDGSLSAFATADGAQVWQVATGLVDAAVRPVIAGGFVYLGSSFGGRLVAIGSNEGSATTATGQTSHYTSAAYGFRLTYDPQVWQPTNESDESLAISDGETFVLLSKSSLLPDEASACVNAIADQLAKASSRQDYTRVLQPDGAPLAQAGADAAFAIYSCQARYGSERCERIECRALPGRPGVVTIVAGGPLPALRDAMGQIDALLAGLDLE